MKQKIVQALILSLLIWVLPASPVLAQTIPTPIPDPRQAGIPSLFQTPEGIVGAIFNLVISLAGAIFIILLLVGGIQYLTSAGNEETTGKAKRLMVDALVGLVITVAAFAIGTYILGRLGFVRGGGGPLLPPAPPGSQTPTPAPAPSPSPAPPSQQDRVAAFEQGRRDGQEHQRNYQGSVPCDSSSPFYRGGSYGHPDLRSEYDSGFRVGCGL